MLNEYATPMRLMMQFSSWMSVRFWPILLKNSKMRPLHFLAKLSRDRQFAV
jgi:hypothetical protein